jgi:hypothetical protein
LTYLERQKCYGPDKKILFKKQLFDLEVKGQGPTKVITVCDTPPYGHAPTYQNIIDLSGKIKKLWSTSFADEKQKKKRKKKIRLKHYVSLRSKGGHNYNN